MRLLRLTTLAILAGTAFAVPCVRSADDAADWDEEFLKRYNVKTDNASLLEFLRVRSGAGDPAMVAALVQQLGDDDPEVRDGAQRKLIALELPALNALRAATKEKDPERARRAKDCITAIEKQTRVNLPLITIRLLARRGSTEAVRALLDYLPNGSADPDVEEEVYYCLDELGVREGKINADLMAALSDKSPARRAVAGCIIGRVGNPEQKANVRKLLNDADAKVRLRAAQGLLAGKEKAALPVLIELIGEASLEIAWSAEELVHYATVEASSIPSEVVGTATIEERSRCRDAWKRWWTEHGNAVDLAKAEQGFMRPRLLLVREGLTSIDEQGYYEKHPNFEHNRMLLVGGEGHARFQFPVEVKIPSQSVLLPPGIFVGGVLGRGEFTLREWDLKGKQLRSTPAIAGHCVDKVQRRPDGRTLVHVDDIVIDVSADGDASRRLTMKLPGYFYWTWHGHLGADGWFRALLGEQRAQGGYGLALAEHDPIHESWTVATRLPDAGRDGEGASRQGRLSLMHDGHWAIARFMGQPDRPKYSLMKVARTGNVVWRHDGVTAVSQVHALRNGHLLCIFEVRQNPYLAGAVEYDRQGLPVWEAVGNSTWWPESQVIYPLVQFGFSSVKDDEGLSSARLRIWAAKSRNVEVRRRAAEVLTTLPSTPEVIEIGAKLLTDEDEEVRCSAATMLGRTKDVSRTIVLRLIRAIDDTSLRVEGAAYMALIELGRQAVPMLLEEYAKGAWNERVRRDILLSLIPALKTDHEQLVPIIRKALERGPKDTRVAILRALAWENTRGELFIPELLTALRDGDEFIALTAGQTLCGLGPRGEKAIPDLIKALERRQTRQNAAIALQGIGMQSPDVIKALIRALADKDDVYGRMRSVIALADAQACHDEVVTVLIEMLTDRSDIRVQVMMREVLHERPIQLAAVFSLRQLGLKAKPAAQALKAIVEDKTQKTEVRRAALDALGCIDPDTARKLRQEDLPPRF
jgi:HEAT repeat protein